MGLFPSSWRACGDAARALLCAGALLGCGDDPPRVDAATPLDAPALAPVLSFVDGEGREARELPYGEPFAVRASGLAPDAPVTVRAALWGYRSWARVRAAGDGTIDLARDAALEGTWTGIDPHAIWWSMRRESDEVGVGYDVEVTLEDEHGAMLARESLVRLPLGHGATRIDVREEGLVATLFVPADPAPHPAVITLGGSEGGLGTATFRAASFASLGYASLAVAYFGEAGLPATLEEIPVESIERAIAWLAARPEIDASRLALWGASRGAELALEVAAGGAPVRAVIAEAPSGVRWSAVLDASAAAWTRDAMPLAWLRIPDDADPEWVSLPDGSVAARSAPMFIAALDAASAAELGAATIGVEASDASFLFLGGSDDGLWPSCALADVAWERLEGAGHVAAHRDERVCFEGAGHLLGVPGWPTSESLAIAGSSGAPLALGGTPGAIAHAQVEAHARIRAFLATALE